MIYLSTEVSFQLLIIIICLVVILVMMMILIVGKIKIGFGSSNGGLDDDTDCKEH